MAQGKPYQAYQNTSVATANQKKLIVMLYDGVNRFLSQAIRSIEANNPEAAHNQLMKGSKIIMELLTTLREETGGEVTQNLKQLYVYCYENLVLANLTKDIEKVRSVQRIMNNLREGWVTATQAAAPAPTQQRPVGQAGGYNPGLKVTG